jgi:histidinol-phosphate aminotransferase
LYSEKKKSEKCRGNINKDEYEWLLKKVPKHILIIADEAYYEFAKDIDDYPKALDYKRENVIVLRTFSKAYGLAGFRVGYGIASEEIISNLLKTKLTFEPTTLGQAAALAAYEDEEFLEKSVQLVKKGKERLYSLLDKYAVNYKKSISNSVMMIFPTEKEAIEFTQKMLELGVILRRINAFGLPNCVRITIGIEEEMDHFEESFKNVMQNS